MKFIVSVITLLILVSPLWCQPLEGPSRQANPPTTPVGPSPSRKQFIKRLESLTLPINCRQYTTCESCVGSSESYGRCGWYASLRRCAPGDALGAIEPMFGPMFFLSCRPGPSTCHYNPSNLNLDSIHVLLPLFFHL